AASDSNVGGFSHGRLQASVLRLCLQSATVSAPPRSRPKFRLLRPMRHGAVATVSARSNRLDRRWIDAAAVTLIVVSVSAIYGSRLTTQSLVREETRWASGAREMLATGDWVVPRQQGRVFPERPPMTMWTMAAVGWFRGDVDAIAIRLPSVIAVVLTSLL